MKEEQKKREEADGSGFGRLTVQGVLYINNIIRALPLSLSLVWMCVYIYVYTQVVSQVTHTTWRIYTKQDLGSARRFPTVNGAFQCVGVVARERSVSSA